MLYRERVCSTDNFALSAHPYIAQSDRKIPCRYHFQVDYELCACDVLLSSFKTEIVSSFIYSIIFKIADERLILGKIYFNI